MRTHTKEELAEILEAHAKWLLGRGEGKKADLRGSNLSYSNLSYSDLRSSDLRGSDLRGSNLIGSNLSYSDLRGSDLRGSDLRGSDLSYSNLSYSDLRGSDLRGSDLSDSNLSGSKRWDSEVTAAPIEISPIGSENGTLFVWPTKRGIIFHRGCFNGTEAEFREKIADKHGENDHAKIYLATIDMVKLMFIARKVEVQPLTQTKKSA